MADTLDTGVYCIRNTVNGKVYVGSSASKSIERRITDHRRNLRNGVHYNQRLQGDWDQYGEGAFEPQTLMLCPPEECIANEQRFIDALRSADEQNGYNIQISAAFQRGTPKRCSTAGCDRPVKSRDLCEMHYGRWWYHNMRVPKPPQNPKRCIIEGCGKSAIARGLCRTHYGRWWNHGTTADPQATPEERFWPRVNKNGPIHPTLGQCWVWTGGKFRRGYGAFSLKRKLVKAHRFSWELHNGPIPDGLIVLHGCDNPSCVNPSHLSVGTDADNIADRDQKGRTTKGEDQHFAKLTTEQVLEIRQRYERDSSTSGSTALAREYGVSHPTILRVVKGRCWKHVATC